MRKLYLKIVRNLWQMKLNAAAIIVSVSCGVMVAGGLDMAIKSLACSRDLFLERLNFADLEVNFLPEDVQNIPLLENNEQIEKAERRLIFPGTVSLNKKKIKGLMILSESSTPQVNQLEVVEGRRVHPDDPDEVVVEAHFARYHAIQVGDGIEMRVGEKVYHNRVVGIVQTPEFFMISSNPDYEVPEKGSLGVLFGSLSRIEKSLGFLMANDIVVKLKEGVPRDEAIERILQSLSSLRIEKIIRASDHFSYRHLQIDIQAFRIYAPAIIVILGGLSFIISLINFNRLVLREHKEIGASMAIGYSYNHILRSYLFGGLIIAVLSTALGTGLSLLLRNAFTGIFASSHDITNIENRFFFTSAFYGIAFGFLTVGMGVLLPARMFRKPSVQDIIRLNVEKTTTARRHGAGDQLPLVSMLPLTMRWSVRNLSRRKLIAFFNILSIALAIGVAISYMLTFSSLHQTIVNRSERQAWDMVVDFLHPVLSEDVDRIREIPGIRTVEPFLRSHVQIEAKNRVEDSSLLGLAKSSPMRRLKIVQGRGIENPDDIVLSRNLAEKLRLNVHDTIMVKSLGKTYPFNLSGIISDIIPSESVVLFPKAQEILQYTEEATGAFITADPFRQSFLGEELSKKDFVGKVTNKSEIVGALLQVIQEVGDIVTIPLWTSVLVSLLFIFTIVNLNVAERQAEYAVLRSIGADNADITKTVLTEVFTEGFLAAVLAIPFSIGLFSVQSFLLGKAWLKVDPAYPPGDFLQAIVPVFVLIPLAVYPSLKYIFTMDITRTLRTKIME